MALVQGDRFWPIEVKWRSRLRPKDLRQIAKYPNGVIAARTREVRETEGVPVIPVVQALALLGEGRWPPEGLTTPG